MELQITQTCHPLRVADRWTDGRKDRQMDGRSGPTTRPAFAKATQVIMSLFVFNVPPIAKVIFVQGHGSKSHSIN